MNFMQQMDEIYFIIRVKKYTNGIDFHHFHGGKFLPCQIVSALGGKSKNKIPYHWWELESYFKKSHDKTKKDYYWKQARGWHNWNFWLCMHQQIVNLVSSSSGFLGFLGFKKPGNLH